MFSTRWRQLRRYMNDHGLLPESRLAKFTLYLVGVDVFLILYHWVAGRVKSGGGESVNGWITFLSYLASFLFVIVAIRWFRRRVMWALRNRLIVTYMFIGVIPVVLLLAMGMLVVYLFVGQFATYVASSDLQSEIRRLDAVNERLATEIATSVRHGHPITDDIIKNASANEEAFSNREVTAWYKGKPYILASDEQPATAAARPQQPVEIPKNAQAPLTTLSLDGLGVNLRSLRKLKVGNDELVVISSMPLDRELMGKVAAGIGVVSMTPSATVAIDDNPQASTRVRVSGSNETFEIAPEARGNISEIESAAPLPPAKNRLDRDVVFPSTVPVMDWKSGEQRNILMLVHTRPSLMYEKLFRTVGNWVNFVLIVLVAVGIFFGIIELIALIIGVRLTRTITQSVYKLYQATQHVNRRDFSHRIKVTSKDQLAALETSFNGMTENIQKLLLEQKEKQRLENELSIAQEVQAQLFPTGVVDVQTLELYGYCRPARTVSGDYYDFVPLGSDRVVLAVGDISGKGISAALLMATIHSAVRAYSLERAPMAEAQNAGRGSVGAAVGGSYLFETEISPSLLCTMLNRQLFRSTPLEKYATIFLGAYDGESKQLTYCNAGHLPPLIMASDGSVRKLDQGGSVIGLLDGLSFEQASVTLRPGDIFIAYSDGVTEPENEFGEFGEERLLQIVQENQYLPLQRIADMVVSAVSDWIGGAEQPDDVTVVLARLR